MWEWLPNINKYIELISSLVVTFCLENLVKYNIMLYIIISKCYVNCSDNISFSYDDNGYQYKFCLWCLMEGYGGNRASPASGIPHIFFRYFFKLWIVSSLKKRMNWLVLNYNSKLVIIIVKRVVS